MGLWSLCANRRTKGLASRKDTEAQEDPSLLLSALSAPEATGGQSVEGAGRAGDPSNRYRIISNVTYLTSNNWEAKLDVILEA